mgnify:CR=1 FL=1
MAEDIEFSGITDAQRRIISYWNSLSEHGLPARRSDIDPGALRNHLADITLIEVDGRGRKRLRIAGSRVRDLLGGEMRGCDVDDLTEETASMLMTGVESVLQRQQPVGGLIDCKTHKHAWLRLPVRSSRWDIQIVLCHDSLIRKDLKRAGVEQLTHTLARFAAA